MRQLHLVFNIVKLSAAPEDPISERKLQALLPSIVINGEPEWEVEEILDSCWHQRRFQFLIKWKGFSREHNSWEAASNVKALDLVTEYYCKHPATPRHIRWTDFNTLFKSGTIASRHSNLRGGKCKRTSYKWLWSLYYSSRVTLQLIKYYYVIFGLTSIIPRALCCLLVHFHCSDPGYPMQGCKDTVVYNVDYSLQELHLILWEISWR